MQCRGSQPPPELHYGAEQGTPPRCTAALQLRAASCAHEGVHFCTHVCAVPQELKRACTHTASSAPKAVGAPAARLCPRGEEGLRGAGRGSRPGRGRTRPPTPQREKDKAAGGGRAATLTPDSPPHTPLCPRDGTTGRGGMSTPGRGAVGGNEERLTAGGLRAPHPRSAALPAPHRDGVRGKPRRGRSRSQRGGGGMKGWGRRPPAPFPQFGAAGTAPERGGGGTAPAATTQPPNWSRWVPPRRGGSGGGQRPRPALPGPAPSPGAGGARHAPTRRGLPDGGRRGAPIRHRSAQRCGNRRGRPGGRSRPRRGMRPPQRRPGGATSAPCRRRRAAAAPTVGTPTPPQLRSPLSPFFPITAAVYKPICGGVGGGSSRGHPYTATATVPGAAALPAHNGSVTPPARAPQRTASPALRHRDPLCQPPPTPPDPHTHWQARACCSR